MRKGTGTTSRILWHFTGGPERGGLGPKSPEKAYSNLKSILGARTLRLGQILESVKHRTVAEEAVLILNQEIARVSCLAEIPLQHLHRHEERYGRFAIGFYRECALKAGYRPVLYALLEDEVVKHLMNKADARTLALVKTFSKEEFESTYAEREWRSTTQYDFCWEEAAMVIVPQDHVERLHTDLPGLPRQLPVLSFEDAVLQ